MVKVAVGICVAALAGGLAALASGDGSPSRSDEGLPRAVASRSVKKFHSRPDLRPPRFSVARSTSGVARGDVFVAPFVPRGSGQGGPMIVDNRGEVVWFRPSPRRKLETSFHLQRYRGQPVLTWWQGRPVRGWGQGEYIIADTSYREIARVKAGRGKHGDSHDFVITDRGTALFTVYDPVRRDLSPVGGSRNATVMDGILQEVDIATGRVLLEWHSLTHVGLRDSYKKVPPESGAVWDYFHINAVDVDSDGDLLVSSRNTHAVYKIDRHSGRVIWRLGGKRSDFRMGRGARFAWQHDVNRRKDGAITLFDNEAAPKVRSQSRAIVLHLDEKHKRARLVRSYAHGHGVLAANTGNMQSLDNGNTFVGWGAEPHITEFTRRGRIVFHAHIPRRYKSARAYRAPWTGRPATSPAIATGASRNGKTTIYVSWNGATEVVRWVILAGDGPDDLRAIASAPKRGFETAIRTRLDGSYVAVQALDSEGRSLGRSKVIALTG